VREGEAESQAQGNAHLGASELQGLDVWDDTQPGTSVGGLASDETSERNTSERTSETKRGVIFLLACEFVLQHVDNIGTISGIKAKRIISISGQAWRG
jgi:hypothetical protein